MPGGQGVVIAETGFKFWPNPQSTFDFWPYHQTPTVLVQVLQVRVVDQALLGPGALRVETRIGCACLQLQLPALSDKPNRLGVWEMGPLSSNTSPAGNGMERRMSAAIPLPSPIRYQVARSDIMHDELLSSFAFNCNLRPCMVNRPTRGGAMCAVDAGDSDSDSGDSGDSDIGSGVDELN